MPHVPTDESPSHRRHRARTLGTLYAAGASVSSSVLVLPGWDGVHRLGLAATVVLAATGSLALVLLGSRVSRAMCHGFLVAGALLIAAAQAMAGSGSASAAYAMLYIWVALHASMFFGPAAVGGHLALTTLAHVAALSWVGDLSSVGPRLMLTVGTQVSASLVVGSLTARLRQLADTDSLTGLPNRRIAERALAAALDAATRRRGTSTCVALLDLNDFKQLNDRDGHAEGDRVLVTAAAEWRLVLRPSDTLARTGGDEFTVVLPDCSLDHARGIARRLLDRTPPGVSCAVGLASWDRSETAEELLVRADRALYAAKADGPISASPSPSAETIDGDADAAVSR